MSNVLIEYDELTRLTTESAKVTTVVDLFKADFPDEKCRMVAIKSVLGIKDEEKSEDTEGDDTPSEDTEPTE